MAAGKDVMERVDMKAEFPKMTAAEQYYVKKAEQLNKTRALSHRMLRKKNFAVAGAGLLGVAAIYTYTIMAVKQEKFLDEFDDMHKK